MKTRDSTSTTTGSTLRPGDSSVYRRSIVLLLPPAPADRVLVGRALAIFSFCSAAALRRMAVLGPPGGVGDEGRPDVTAPPGEAAPGPAGEDAPAEDCVLYTTRSVSVWACLAARLAGASLLRQPSATCLVAAPPSEEGKRDRESRIKEK